MLDNSAVLDNRVVLLDNNAKLDNMGLSSSVISEADFVPVFGKFLA